MDASFCFIFAHTRSCWKGIPYPYFMDHQDDKPNVIVDVQQKEPNVGDEKHQEDVPRNGVPTFPYHMQGGASGYSSHDLYIWEQVLENQRDMPCQ